MGRTRTRGPRQEDEGDSSTGESRESKAVLRKVSNRAGTREEPIHQFVIPMGQPGTPRSATLAGAKLDGGLESSLPQDKTSFPSNCQVRADDKHI